MRSGPIAVTFFYAKLDSVYPGEMMMCKHMCVTAAVVLSVTLAVLIPKTVTLVAAPAIQQVAPKPTPSQANLDALPDRITVCRDAIKALSSRAAIDRFPVCDRFILSTEVGLSGRHA
jgi:hypothetical protein